MSDHNLKPVLRIVMWDYDEKKFKVLAEITDYSKYTYTLNHNDTSTGELTFDPAEPQAKDFIMLLNDATWDSKKEDIFIYNINDPDGFEFFKIVKTEFSNESDQKSITLSGNNSFFMTDRIALPDPSTVTDGKGQLDGTLADNLAELLTFNGASYMDEGNIADKTRGNNPTNISLRQYPYLNIDGKYADTFPKLTLKYGYETIKSLADKLFKATLFGYRIKFDFDNNFITISFVLPIDNTDLEISQEMNNENGYSVIIDGSRKTDALFAYKDKTEYYSSNDDALSGGRFIEKKSSVKKQDDGTTVSDQLGQGLIKANDYIIVDMSVVPLTINNLFDALNLGDIVTIKVTDDLVDVTKEAQIKQIMKIASDNEYKIVPIADDSTESVEKLLAEHIRENKEIADAQNY